MVSAPTNVVYKSGRLWSALMKFGFHIEDLNSEPASPMTSSLSLLQDVGGQSKTSTVHRGYSLASRGEHSGGVGAQTWTTF